MDLSRATVKLLSPGRWEVQLGPGILPKIITQADLDMAQTLSGSTIGNVWGMGVGEMMAWLDCIRVVQQWQAEGPHDH